MSDDNIDRVPVNQLITRYKLARSAVYKRMKDLGIDREKIGNRAYVSAEQLTELDSLHDFIKLGGNVAEFIARRGSGSRRSDRPTDEAGSSDLTINNSEMLTLMKVFAEELAAKIQPANPLGYYESLESAAGKGWQLRTSELSDLLKLSVKEIDSYGLTFYEAGFAFNRVGFRSGGEGAWRVTKDNRR
ncbi:MAG: hypothetical protein WA947_12345 [Phormidesmis sp.]